MSTSGNGIFSRRLRLKGKDWNTRPGNFIDDRIKTCEGQLEEDMEVVYLMYDFHFLLSSHVICIKQWIGCPQLSRSQKYYHTILGKADYILLILRLYKYGLLRY